MVRKSLEVTINLFDRVQNLKASCRFYAYESPIILCLLIHYLMTASWKRKDIIGYERGEDEESRKAIFAE